MAVNTLGKRPNLFAEVASWGPSAWTVVAHTTNGTNTAVVAAVAAGEAGGQKPAAQHFLCYATISVSTAYTTATNVQIKDGTTVIYQIELAATAPLVIDLDFSHRPLCASAGNSLSVVQGPSGGGLQTVSIAGFSAPDQASYS